MAFYNKNLGRLGEEIACDYLKKNHFHLLAKNYHTHWGEIDIIAKRENKISFIEVKTRIGTAKGKPYESVTKQKILHLKRAINYYLLNHNLTQYKLSLDVVSIVLDNNGKVTSINYFEGLDWG